MRIQLWLFLLIPLSAAGLLGLLSLADNLPDPERSIHVHQAQFFQGETGSVTRLLEPGRVVDLPHDWRDDTQAEGSQEHWYRIELPLQVPPNRLWGVLLPEIEQNAEIYLNSAIAGGSGSMGEYPSRYANRALYFPVPNGLLKPGVNILDIRVRTYPPGQGYLGTVVIGPEQVLRPFFDQRVLIKSNLLWFFVVASFGMTMIILALAWQRRTETVYRWFAALTAFWTAATGLSVLVDLPLPAPWLIALTGLCSTGFCATSFIFALRFVEVRHLFLELVVLSLALAGWLVIIGTAIWWPHAVFQVAPYSTIAQMALGPFVVGIVLQRFLQIRDPELFLILYAAGILMIFGFFSMSEATGLRSGVGGRYLFYATPLFLGAFAILLLRRFVAAMEESEELNRTLEQRIETKSRELEDNFEVIRQMEQEQVLASERERIMGDMHDGVGGQLVSSLMRLKAEDGDHAGVEQTLQKALTDLRLMIDSLEIGEGDLNLALGMLRGRLQRELEHTGVTLQWQVEELPVIEHLSPHSVLQIMRIIQEAIANVLKHANASNIVLHGTHMGDRVSIELTDDGVGLSSNQAAHQGNGVKNMHHRAADIGAEIEIAASDCGTRVALHVPC